ncbi:hypothetical protein IE53DRAFT_370490 [Violaceomyces palustris]|uniref:Uncharacterized protein n=1 Tax=Violaceomyces palustris TaxID=1673888 RepID=A0ACD0NRW0_9BASI|nr:hypothetical protein IE53DRAFT_370490 [Violaceomyces palustris]
MSASENGEANAVQENSLDDVSAASPTEPSVSSSFEYGKGTSSASTSPSSEIPPRSSSKSNLDSEVCPDQLDSLYHDLPEDVTALKAIIGTMRIEISKRDQTISSLEAEMDQVKASHSNILYRSAEWKDELESLRIEVPKLREDLKTEKRAREDEADRVKDLRLRAEESRRAIMRLQGEQQSSRAKAKEDKRRSMGSSSFAGWNPASVAGSEDQETGDLNRSKRASLAFGPNAGSAAAAAGRAASSGHRRTASSSRSVSGNTARSHSGSYAYESGSDSERAPASASGMPPPGGLRGLRLSGAPSSGSIATLLAPTTHNNNEDGASAGDSSRRSSFHSSAGKSPRSAFADLPSFGDLQDNSGPSGRLLVPGSRSSLPSASPALSQGASSTGMASPIIEDGEEVTFAGYADDGPPTATPFTTESTYLPSTGFTAKLRSDLRAKDVEIEKLTREMSDMKVRVEEANEARLASEACLKALREFISSHDNEADKQMASMGLGGPEESADTTVSKLSVGAGLLRGVKLPPLPTDTDADDEPGPGISGKPRDNSSASSPSKGWNIRLPQLMRKGTGPTSDEQSHPATATKAPSPEAGEKITNGSMGPPTTTANGSALGTGLPSFGSLWSRTGTSATTLPSTGQQPTLHHRESTCSQKSESSVGGAPPDTPAGLMSPGGTSTIPFKGFSWFKKGGTPGPGVPSNLDASSIEANLVGRDDAATIEKVMSPPFASLDFDQVAISRSDKVGAGGGLGLAQVNPTGRISPLGAAIGLDVELGGNKVGTDRPKMPAEIQPSYRAQKALEKTTQVGEDGDFVPAAFD